jgi:hypothetical protein
MSFRVVFYATGRTEWIRGRLSTKCLRCLSWIRSYADPALGSWVRIMPMLWIFYTRFTNILSTVIIRSSNRSSQTVSTATCYFGLNESVNGFKNWLCPGKHKDCVVAGFRRSVNEICALLGFYTAQNVSLLPTFRGNQCVRSAKVKNQDCLNFEDGINMFSGNVGNKLTFCAA